MISSRFRYFAPETIEEAVALLADGPTDALVLGGGTMLIPAMTRAESKPELLIDLRRLGLKGIFEDGDDLIIEAKVTYDDVLESTLVARIAPVLAQMASGVTGGHSITGQGTLVGSACFANPASDVPVCLASLGARIRLASSTGLREVPLSQFFVGGFETSRRRGEIGLALLVPKPQGRVSSSYRKVKPSGSSWPIITVACVIEQRMPDAAKLSLAIGGLASTPLHASTDLPIESSEAQQEFVAALVRNVALPWSDDLADAEYRSLAAPAVALRVLLETLGRHRG